MNFIDRTSLGDMLALRLQQFNGKDAVILCLQESSLLTCLTVASQIRAWLYPLAFEPVYTDDHARRLLGAYNQDGTFCPLPEDPTLSRALIPDDQEAAAEAKEAARKDSDAHEEEIRKHIKKQKAAAMKSIADQLDAYAMPIDKHQMDGRDVILAADVLTSTAPIAAARELLKEVRPRSLTAAVGNATPEAALFLRLNTGSAEVLDVLSGITFDHERYFEHQDSYTPEQKHTLTQHIAAYWQ